MTNNFEHLSDKEFEELKRVFYSQAYEIVENLQDLALSLESSPEDNTALKAIKRYVHTLKGDSNSFGLTSVGTICHSIEDILSSLIDGSRHAEHEAIDMLLSCIDTINRLLVGSESGIEYGDTKGIIEKIDLFLQQSETLKSETLKQVQGDGLNGFYCHAELVSASLTEYQKLQIQDALKNGLNIYEIEIVFNPMCREKGVGAFMITQALNGIGQIIHSMPDIEGSDIDKAKKMTLLLSTELAIDEIRRNAFITGITIEINVKPYSPSQSPQSSARPAERSESGKFGERSKERSLHSNTELPLSELTGGSRLRSEMLRVEASKVDNLMNLVGELIIGRSMIDQIARDIEDGDSNDIASRLLATNSYVERTVSDLQKGIMKMRMVPINHVFRKFPKLVRDLSVEKGKQVRLDIQGRETELDKGIVDALGEPLSHIIRNFIDHGIEDPAYRRSTGKLEEGVITLNAYHEAAQIVIEASDDGRGIDIDRLKKKALEKGFLAAEEIERLSDIDSTNLIFLPGLSTSETISETSGRGIGMDAVKSVVEAMKGSVEVESTPDKGTKFTLRLPLTLAVIKALLFEAGQRLYAVPISVIAEVTRITMDDLVTVDGKDTLLLRDQIISIIHLQELFRINSLLKGRLGTIKKKFILILGIGNKKVGLLVDRLIGQQELVIKAVDTHYTQSGLVAGASILGDGKVVLILDAPAIFKRAVEDERSKINRNITCHPELVSGSQLGISKTGDAESSSA